MNIKEAQNVLDDFKSRHIRNTKLDFEARYSTATPFKGRRSTISFGGKKTALTQNEILSERKLTVGIPKEATK